MFSLVSGEGNDSHFTQEKQLSLEFRCICTSYEVIFYEELVHTFHKANAALRGRKFHGDQIVGLRRHGSNMNAAVCTLCEKRQEVFRHVNYVFAI